MKFILFVASLCFFQVSAHAQSISLGEEFNYSYNVEFRSLVHHSRHLESESDPFKLAINHVWHVYGLFHSSYYLESSGFPAELSVGFAGTTMPQVTEATSFTKENDPYLWVRYRAEARAVLHPV